MAEHEIDLHIGDEVILVDEKIIDENKGLHNGSTGVIRVIRQDWTRNLIGVEWDEWVDGGHDLDDYPTRRGWWVPPKSIEAVGADDDVSASDFGSLEELLGF